MKIWAKTEEFKEGKFLVVRRDGSVPHWPHFVLGARDPAASQTLLFYAACAEEMGMDIDYCNSIRELAADFNQYRLEQGMGDPPAGPHRTDDPDVIHAMRGGDSVIRVRPDKGNVMK